MAKGYLPYHVDQQLLLPPDMRQWLREGHLALFVLDMVSSLDLSAFTRVHAAKDARGRAGYPHQDQGQHLQAQGHELRADERDREEA